MKKIIIIFFLFFFLSSCSGGVTFYDDNQIDEFDKLLLLENAIKYDVRIKEDCEKGHIKGFMCMRKSSSNVDEVCDIIKKLYPKHKTIVLISEGNDAAYLAKLLSQSGYKDVHVFKNGYLKYKELKNGSFVEEIGCNC